jgi:hypothetical protein
MIGWMSRLEGADDGRDATPWRPRTDQRSVPTGSLFFWIEAALLRRQHEGMERTAAILEIREKANVIASNITAIHPLVGKLADAPTQSELLKALFELTKQVEVVKKHLLKLEKRDDSALV